ncbi:hypothetical protein INR49_001263 [Caranx melampygus]|nr:hypothetical protein INR49_001263 [Caranx melampygus]
MHFTAIHHLFKHFHPGARFKLTIVFPAPRGPTISTELLSPWTAVRFSSSRRWISAPEQHLGYWRCGWEPLQPANWGSAVNQENQQRGKRTNG